MTTATDAGTSTARKTGHPPTDRAKARQSRAGRVATRAKSDAKPATAKPAKPASDQPSASAKRVKVFADANAAPGDLLDRSRLLTSQTSVSAEPPAACSTTGHGTDPGWGCRAAH